MCGIAGILSKKNENVVPMIECMLSSMSSRGPDGAGVCANKHVIRADILEDLRFDELSGKSALGHLRLAIVGGTCGQQPFCSCNGRFIVEHNGEIYNYKKIRNKLEKSHSFVT